MEVGNLYKEVNFMKTKKFFSLLLAVLLLCGSVSASFESIAANVVSAESFAEAIEELNEAEAEEKTIEESVNSRVILKAAKQPDVYGDAVCIKGTAGKYILQYDTESEATEALAYYRSLSFVKWAELDCLNETQALNYGNYMLGSDEALEYIESHQLNTSKTIVAVIDSGIDTSSEFYTDNERMIDSGINLSNSGKANSAHDDFGHGTNVCAIVLDNTNDNVEVVAYKAMNKNGEGSELDICTCIDLAVENGANVINLSLGREGEPTNAMLESIQNALDNDVTVVVAAGNEGRNAAEFSPACIEECITVAAIDQNGNEDFYSNYGNGVDFAAPGHNIYNNYGTFNRINGAYSGTSFSAPFIAAASAMVKSFHPDDSRREVESTLKNSCVTFEDLNYHDGFHKDLEFFLSDTDGDGSTSAGWTKAYADYPTPDNKEVYYGSGMPNVPAAIIGERTQAVSFSVESGHYIDRVFNLKLLSEEGAEIYYTTDQSYPSKFNGTLYTGNIVIDGTTSIRAVAYVDGKAPSLPKAREYRMEYHDFDESHWEINEEGHLISYTGTVTELIIPETIKGISVKRLGTLKTLPEGTPSYYSNTVSMKHSNAKFITSINLPKTYETGTIQHSTHLKFVTSASKVMPCTGASSASSWRFYRDWDEDENKTLLSTPSLVSIIAPNVEIVKNLEGSYIQEAYFPNAKEVADKAFYDCECLKKVTLGEASIIGEEAFTYCFGLREIDAKGIQIISNNAFQGCNRLRTIDLSEVTEIGDWGLWHVRQLKGALTLPKLKTLGAYGISETVTSLCLPEAEYVGHYPVLGEDICLIVSSKMTECPLRRGLLDFTDFDIHNLTDVKYNYYHIWYRDQGIYDYKNSKIYGTPNTYAQQFAKDNKYTFIPLPLLESEPENMGYQSSGMIKAEVIGFNKQIQWYGTNRKDNHGGSALKGETSEDLDTSKYNYKYFYCKVKTSDGDYKKDIITGESNLNYYDFNKDGTVDIQDVSILLIAYGDKAQQSTSLYDINEDNVIDIADLSIELSSDIYGVTA